MLAASRDTHLPDAKQVLLWKGWVLKQRLNDVQSSVRATATRAHVESPLRTELFVDSCSGMTSGQLLREHTRNPTTCISICTQGTKRCSCDKTAALARHKHTWISLRAQTDMFRRKDCCVLTTRAHLDLFSVHKQTCSCDNTAAFARREHTWISLRAQARRHVPATGCCALTPRAHLDLVPCAKRHVPSKTLLRSRAASQDRWFLLADARSSFYSQARTRPLRYREPVTRNPSHHDFALQIVDPIRPISVYAVGE